MVNQLQMRKKIITIPLSILTAGKSITYKKYGYHVLTFFINHLSINKPFLVLNW